MCCLFSVACCLSSDACRWWRRVLFLVVECWLSVVVCLLRAVRLSLVIIVSWGVACCVVGVCCLLFVGCCLFMGCCVVFVVGLLLCDVS